MQVDKFSWVCGFFEGQSSFSVLISLLESKNKKRPNKQYAIFKPRISIGNVDEQQTEFIYNTLGIEHTKPKNRKLGNTKTNLVVIQNPNDIEKVVEFLRKYRFTSIKKQKSFDTFMVAFELLKAKNTFTEWDDEMVEYVRLKMLINNERTNIDKKRIDQDRWIERIKEHLKERVE